MTRAPFRLSLIVALSACSILDAEPGERDRLADARARWEGHGVEDYAFELRTWCGECAPEATNPLQIVVTDGVVTEVRDMTTGAPPGPYAAVLTVPELFGLVEALIDQDLPNVTVRYDARLGYPSDVSWSYPPPIQDGFGGHGVRSFQYSPGLQGR